MKFFGFKIEDSIRELFSWYVLLHITCFRAKQEAQLMLMLPFDQAYFSQGTFHDFLSSYSLSTTSV